MANRLVIQAMIIGVVLGMASGASAEGEVVTPIQQGEVDMGAAITLDEAAAAQAGIQATLGEMQAVAGAMAPKPKARDTQPRRDFDGTTSIDGVTDLAIKQYEYELTHTTVTEKEDGGIIVEHEDGSGVVVYEDHIIVFDENGKVDVIRLR